MSLGYIGDKIPAEWAKPLLIELVNPKQWKTISTKDLLEDGFVVYGANGKIGFYNEFTHENPTLMITCRGATCGNLHISEPFAYINGNAMALDDQPIDLIGVSFLRHVLEARGLEDTISGSAQPQITRQGLSDVRIPLPPLAEQKVIAEKLDTLLGQVDNTKARLERIPEILKSFRQSVLAAAVSGKLTEEWRGNSNSVKSSQQEDWLWPDIPDSWMVKFYPDVVESRLGKMLDKAKNTGEPTKYLGNINVRWFHFDLENTQEILISKSERDELLLRNGDVLICEGGEPGRCAIWREISADPIIFQKALHRARVKDDVIIPEWLVFNIKNDTNNLTLDQLFTGTTIKHLTSKALKKYPVRIPPLKEQTEIVRRVEELFAFADRIEQSAQEALSRVNNLTQSILAKAFRGELTADWRAANLELISGDNSAEALLAKIKAERAKLSKKAKA